MNSQRVRFQPARVLVPPRNTSLRNRCTLNFGDDILNNLAFVSWSARWVSQESGFALGVWLKNQKTEVTLTGEDFYQNTFGTCSKCRFRTFKPQNWNHTLFLLIDFLFWSIVFSKQIITKYKKCTSIKTLYHFVTWNWHKITSSKDVSQVYFPSKFMSSIY